MNDDELLARLRAADPTRRETHVADDATRRGPSWIDDLTEATMNQTRETTEIGATPPTPQTPQRHRRWIPAAAAAVALAATGIALAVGAGDEPGPPAAQPASTMTLTIAGDDLTASCIQVSADVLRGMEVAFSGTATAVADTSVTITPDRWYKGGNGAAAVNLKTMGPEMVALLGNVQFEEGKRYLITATDGQVNACGFSAEWSAELAELFEQAFG